MRRYLELEWDQNKIIHSPRIRSILGDLASPYVKGMSPNCKISAVVIGLCIPGCSTGKNSKALFFIAKVNVQPRTAYRVGD